MSEKKTTYKAVVFDLDGTILDTIEDIADSLNAVMRKYGYSEHTAEEATSFLGYGGRKLIELSLPGGLSDPRFEDILADYVKHYAENCTNKTRPYPGVPELIKKLLERGCRMGVSSNKGDGEVRRLIDRWYPGFFGSVMGNIPGMRRKPAPDGVYAVLDELGVKAEDAVYVGDGDTDIETAKNAGMDCVSVTWGFRGRDELIKAGARRIADTPEQLFEMITGG